MRISERPFCFALILVACCGGQAHAFDTTNQPEGFAPKIESFSTVNEALIAGVKRLNSGDERNAISALQFAATKGNVAAQWQLGRMYASGQGVDRSDYKAFQYFSQIVKAHSDETRGSMESTVVAKAFVRLGGYLLEGIPNSPVRSNPQRAYELFSYAASYFADPDAQYNLARMYLDGIASPKDPRQAARWLNLSAEKGHVYSQAVLGKILLSGQGVPRQGPLGLSWMYLARQAADPSRDSWVIELYDKAQTDCTDDERRMAVVYAKRFIKAGRGSNNGNMTAVTTEPTE